MTQEKERYRVFSIIERRGEQPFWLNVGLAFPHKDGKGFNIQLQALPLDGRLSLRAFDEDPNAAGGKGASAKSDKT